MSRNPKIDPLRQCKKDGINFIAIKKEKEVTLNPLLIDVCDSYLLIYGRPATLPVGTCLTLYSSLSASLFVITEHDSWSTQWGFFEFPGKNSHCQEAKDGCL